MNTINNLKITFSKVFGLGILAIFTLQLVFILPAKAQADPAQFTPYGANSTYLPTRNADPIPVDNGEPVIHSISPSSSNKGIGTKTITIKGKDFVPGSVARMNGSDRSTTFIDSSHLLMKLGPNDLNRNDSFFITVFNKAPGGGYSNAVSFKMTNTAPASSVGNINNRNNSGAIIEDSPDTFLESVQTRDNEIGNLASSAIFGANGSFLPSGITQWIFFIILVLLIVMLVRKIHGADQRYHMKPLKHD